MNGRSILTIKVLTAFAAGLFAVGAFAGTPVLLNTASAQKSDDAAAPTPEPEFDQAAAVARIREKIKGREKEPAETVFKNIKTFKGMPAGRILAVMQFGFSRSLGVDCTHCHTPENFAAEKKETKQIARDMMKMVGTIRGDLLKNMASLGGRRAVINCTTCHRGDVKPAVNLPKKEN